MLAAGREHAERVWAVEGCNGIGRTTDPVDAHSVALAALYAPAEPGLKRVLIDDDLVVPGLLVDRRAELGRALSAARR